MTHLKQQKRGRSLEEILDLVHRYRRSQLSQRQFIVGEGICLTTLHKYLRRAKAGDQGAVNVYEERRPPALGVDGVKLLASGTVATKDVVARTVVGKPQALGVKEWPVEPRIEPTQWVEVMTGTAEADEADKADGPAEPTRGRFVEMEATYGVGFPGGIRLDIPRKFVSSEVAELLGLVWVVSLKSASHSPADNASR